MVITEKSREIVGPRAFNLEYEKRNIHDGLKDNIISYLGEYRLKQQENKYSLTFLKGFDPKLIDSYLDDSMVLKAQRALERRNWEGNATHREEAELKGIKCLENKLLASKTNDTVLWASPPGPKEEGYGNYGFIYFGKVRNEEHKKDISMLAIRIETPSIGGFNCVFSSLIGKEINFKTAEDFISEPFVISRDVDEKTLHTELMKNFNFLPDQSQGTMLKKIFKRMDRMIEDFVDNPTIEGLYALENLAIKYRKEYEILPWESIIYDKNARLNDAIGEYGYKPPKVGGSCGSSSSDADSLKSNNILSIGSILGEMFLEEDEFGERTFDCPSCHRINVRPKGKLLEKCQHCGSKEVSC